MLICAEAIARAALRRQESRGAHSRLDFPQYDNYWGEHNLLVTKDGRQMKVEACPVVKTAELQPLVDDKKAKEKK